MKMRPIFLIPVFVACSVTVFGQVTKSTDLPSHAALATATASVANSSEEPSYTYVGSSKCKKCHISEYKSWAKTAMGSAFGTLKPGEAAEIKTKHGLDPAKDYTTDASCLACHTTGYGHEGGYTVPDPSNKKAVRKAKKLANAGCESCHGPGSAYIKIFQDIFKSKRKYKVEELHAAGLQKIDAATCAACHNDKSPTIEAGAKFDFKAKVDEDTHERKELKQREG